MPPYAGPPIASRSGDAASPLRLLAYLVLAITLIVLDDQAGWLARVREQANVLVQPVWTLAGLPGRLGNQVRDNAASHGQLVAENRQLRNQLLVANARLTRLQTAALDNAQLRELLNVAERSGLDVQLAPILDIDLDPVKQRLVLAAGTREGVHVGQAVIDAGGLMGQVISTTGSTATVLLLTDPDHAVPVTVARTGVRLIVYGRGDTLELRDIPLSAGVEVGDEIVTSGLGGRFPVGFPVGTISALRPDDTHAFLVGDLTPAAQLDRGRDVLLLRPGAAIRVPPPVPAGEQVPVGDRTPVGDQAPVGGRAPVSDRTPVGGRASVGGRTPVSDRTSVGDDRWSSPAVGGESSDDQRSSPTNTVPTNTAPTTTAPTTTAPTNTAPTNTAPTNTAPTNTPPVVPGSARQPQRAQPTQEARR